MSSDSIALVRSFNVDHMQGARAPVRAAKPEQADVAGRKVSVAVHGQDMPPGKTGSNKEMQQYESAVSRISDFVQNFQRDLLFSIDKDTDRLVVKVVDSQTQKVIRQIPSEETLRIARNLDSPDSVIFREQA